MVDAPKLAELLQNGMLRAVYHQKTDCGGCGSWRTPTRWSAKT